MIFPHTVFLEGSIYITSQDVIVNSDTTRNQQKLISKNRNITITTLSQYFQFILKVIYKSCNFNKKVTANYTHANSDSAVV